MGVTVRSSTLSPLLLPPRERKSSSERPSSTRTPRRDATFTLRTLTPSSPKRTSLESSRNTEKLRASRCSPLTNRRRLTLSSASRLPTRPSKLYSTATTDSSTRDNFRSAITSLRNSETSRTKRPRINLDSSSSSSSTTRTTTGKTSPPETSSTTRSPSSSRPSPCKDRACTLSRDSKTTRVDRETTTEVVTSRDRETLLTARTDKNKMQGRNNMQQNMGGNRGQGQQQMTMPTLPMPAVGGQAPVQMPQTQDPAAAAFYAKTHKIVPSVKADNPHLKQHVGNAIFDFVTQLRGQSLAPKITGMLIDLPLEETQMYLMNYPEFVKKVNEAANLLTQMQQPQAQMPQPGMPMP